MQEKKLPIFSKAENVSLKILSIYQQRKKITMPVNTLNNEKTNSIKESLAELLNQLKGVKRTFNEVVEFAGIGLPFPFHFDIGALNKGIHTLERLKFTSVDDLDSVTKLRESELFFLKTDGLKEFKFPDYKSEIEPTFLIYAGIEIQLDALLKKANDLFCRGFSDAGNTAHKLIFDLKELNRTYSQEKKHEKYKFIANNIIDEARPILAQHRGCKKILGNLTLLILTLGTAFIVNKTINGHFLFFQKTDSAKQLDELSQILAGEKHLLP